MKAVERRMDNSGETQVSLTDPDARAMATTSRKPRVVGYNVQSAVETKHHLIVAHEVTNLGYDRDALAMYGERGLTLDGGKTQLYAGVNLKAELENGLQLGVGGGFGLIDDSEDVILRTMVGYEFD